MWRVSAAGFGLIVLLASGCQKEATPLTPEAATGRIESRIKEQVPGIQLSRPGPSTLTLLYPDGFKAQVALDSAIAVCSRQPAACDAHVDSLLEVMRKDEELEEEEEEE